MNHSSESPCFHAPWLQNIWSTGNNYNISSQIFLQRLWCGPALESPLRTVSGWLAEFDVNAWGRHDGLSPSEARLGCRWSGRSGIGSLVFLWWLLNMNGWFVPYELGIVIPSDSYFSEGLKPPTCSWIMYFWVGCITCQRDWLAQPAL